MSIKHWHVFFVAFLLGVILLWQSGGLDRTSLEETYVDLSNEELISFLKCLDERCVDLEGEDYLNCHYIECKSIVAFPHAEEAMTINELDVSSLSDKKRLFIEGYNRYNQFNCQPKTKAEVESYLNPFSKYYDVDSIDYDLLNFDISGNFTKTKFECNNEEVNIIFNLDS